MTSSRRPDIPVVTLRPGREKSVIRRHPWIFSGAVSSVSGDPGRGETVELRDSSGRPLAIGAWSPESSIRVRTWSADPEEAIDRSFFERRLERAFALRRRLGLLQPEGGCRIVHAESDGLPGFIVDLYRDVAVCQFLSAGADYHRDVITALLMDRAEISTVWERSDAAVREKEGLEPRRGLVAGREPEPLIEITEEGCRYLVDIREGHKTGFYLDQRTNRALVRQSANGRSVLNCFSYTGAFGIAAAIGGASEIVNVDTSAAALELASRNASLNGVTADFEICEADVFSRLRGWRSEGRKFDCVILDPPKFAEARGQVDRACRGYKDINILAFQLLAPAGLLFTFSCSGAIAFELFQKVVADAAIDAGRDTRILMRLEESPDHSVPLTFPEGRYLKGMKIEAGD